MLKEKIKHGKEKKKRKENSHRRGKKEQARNLLFIRKR